MIARPVEPHLVLRMSAETHPPLSPWLPNPSPRQRDSLQYRRPIVIVSVHLAEVGWRRAPRLLRERPRLSDVPGLTYAEPVLSTPLRDGPVPRPGPGRIGLIAAWEDDSALDRFLDDHPLAARFVSTFSLWRSAAAMREYAYSPDGAHQAAVRADRAKPFHREAAFIRFRPYASQGNWSGRDPLAA
jgi:hypothetical protein